MPFPDPLATVALYYNSDEGGPFVMVLHFFQVSVFGAGQTQADELAAAVDAQVGTNLQQCISADCEYVKTVVSLNNGGVVYVAENANTAGNGGVAGTSLPDTVAAVVQKRTDAPGKPGRGRWYIGCVPESFQDTGKLTLTAVGAYNALASSARADEATASGNWRSGHQSRKNVTVVPITATHVAPFTGTLRRRRVRA